MRILYAPFAARSPSLSGQPSPKDYPHAKELAELLETDHELIQVAGNGDVQVAKDVRRNLPFKEVGKLIEESDTGICVDSYLQHYYWYLNRRAIVLFGPSDPVVFGHPENLNLLRDRSYLRPNQFDLYYTTDYKPEAFVSPQEVLDVLQEFTKIIKE
jgi:ADP-heptose:LPS heptosyltransferase